MLPCNREGCDRPARSRGMCPTHYVLWLRKMKKDGIKGPAESAEKRMLAAMPGTYEQIAEETGHGYYWTQKVVERLHRAGKAHVCDNLPPKNVPGSRWARVFKAGKGRDVEVTPEQKYEHMMARRRELHEKKKGKKNRPPFTTDPLLAAFYAPPVQEAPPTQGEPA